MMLSVLLSGFVVSAHNAPPPCSLIISQSMRPAMALELTLRATPDSVRDPVPADSNATGHRTRVSWDTAAVYAQVFSVVQIGGDTTPLSSRGPSRVAVVWWNLGVQCQRTRPQPAVQPALRDLFLVAQPRDRRHVLNERARIILSDLRPESEWIEGMPTFDVTQGAWIYSPEFPRPVNLPATTTGSLSVAEYREMYGRLPGVSLSIDYSARPWQELVHWGAADPRRWNLYPASTMLCLAAHNAGDTATYRIRC
jgi:hypothetical protein